MRAKRPFKRWSIGLLLLSISLVGLAITSYMRRGLLLPRARRITSVNNYAHGFDYQWISDHQVVFLKVPIPEAIVVDTNNGRETLRTPFSAIGYDLRLPIGLVSPDGKWLLKRSPHSSPGNRWIAVSVDGTRQIRWPNPGKQAVEPPKWMPDSLHWVQTFDGEDDRGRYLTGAAIYSLNDPHKTRMIHFHGEGWPFLLGVTTDRYALLDPFDYIRKPVSSVVFHQYSLDTPSSPVNKIFVRLPHSATVRQIALSPQGDQLAWILQTTYNPSVLPWLKPICSWLGMRPKELIGIWVSDVHGGHMHEIGHVENIKDTTPMQIIRTPLPAIHFMSWLPGGKRLSFIYQDALWTVPAD